MTHISGHVREHWEITWSAPNVVLYPDVLSLLLTRTELHTFSTCWSVRVCSPLCHHVAQRRWRPPADGGSCRWVAKDKQKSRKEKNTKKCKMEEKHWLSASKVQSDLFIYTGSIIYIVCVLSHLFILYFCLVCPCWNFYLAVSCRPL